MKRTTAAEEVELARRIQLGDEDAVAELVMRNRPLAVRIARPFHSPGHTPEDWVQWALIGMVKAARTFDPDRGVRYGSWAVWQMRSELNRYYESVGPLVGTIRQRRRVGRPAGEVDTCSTEELLSELQAPDWPAPWRTTEQRIDLRHAIEGARLTPRERRVLYLRFAADAVLDEIGAEFGVGRERARQIMEEALAKLRRWFARHGAGTESGTDRRPAGPAEAA